MASVRKVIGMKILALFLDMLGSQYLNVCNKTQKNTSMDDFLRELGGTLYSNCYSPAPDTPRCSACMWTGLYPRKNHCNTRVKWPKNSLNDSVDNIWKVLKKSNYRINIFMNDSTNKLGLVPIYGDEHIYGDTIYDFFKSAEVTENSFNFFYLPDMHYVMDEVGYSEYGFIEGINLLLDIVKKIFNYYNARETFDYIFMFSDHGFQEDGRRYDYLINDDRIKTFMLVRKKSEEKLQVDTKIRSNMDLAPTIYDIIGYKTKNKLDGKSLFNQRGYNYVLIEEMDNLYTEISQSVEHWCVVTQESKHWLECSGKWRHEFDNSTFDDNKFKKIIEKKMCDYKKNHDVYDTAVQYRKYSLEHLTKDCYSNGDLLGKQMYIVSDDMILEKKKVVLYAAGRVGKDYFEQLKRKEEVEIVGWIDINFREIGQEYIRGLDYLAEVKFDYIIICLDSEKVAKQVKLILTQFGIDETKLYWEKPKRVRIPRE